MSACVGRWRLVYPAGPFVWYVSLYLPYVVSRLASFLTLTCASQEIFVERLKPLLQAVFPPSRQLVLFGIFIYLLPLRWLIQLQQEKPATSSSSSTSSRDNKGGGGTPQGGGKGHMHQLLGALVELGEALVDEDERAEVLRLLQKISPQEVRYLFANSSSSFSSLSYTFHHVRVSQPPYTCVYTDNVGLDPKKRFKDKTRPRDFVCGEVLRTSRADIRVRTRKTSKGVEVPEKSSVTIHRK